MKNLHRLLQRQVKKILHSNVDDLPPEIRTLIRDINDTYFDTDREKRLMERMQENSEKEINQFRAKEKDSAVMESKLSMLHSFSRFVPVQFLEFLGHNSIEETEKGDAVEKEMTVLFCDIRNFTQISENLSPSEVFAFLNDYLEQLGPAVNNNYGFIDKFVGDSIMALFPESTDRALQAAVEMMQRLDMLNSRRAMEGQSSLQIGIGMHFGKMTLGTVGSHNRLDTTVVGDSVNLASRLEGLTRVFNIPFILSDDVYQRLTLPEKYKIREIDIVLVKGKENPVTIYEVFIDDLPIIQQQKVSTKDDFKQGLLLYRKGDFKAALPFFKTCLEVCDEDNIAEEYIKRCEVLIKRPSAAENWSGISRLIPEYTLEFSERRRS